MNDVSDLHFKVCESAEDIQVCTVTRGIVFCGEQGISYRLEHDEHDGYAKLERIVC